MPRHTRGKPVFHPHQFDKPGGEELEKHHSEYLDLIGLVGPIDEQAAPDHDHDEREVDPMKPAQGQRVFFGYVWHRGRTTLSLRTRTHQIYVWIRIYICPNKKGAWAPFLCSIATGGLRLHCLNS